jgi:hypothetical protein
MDMAICAFRDYANMIADPEHSTMMLADENAVGIALSGLDSEAEEAVRAVYMYAPRESITSSKIAARVRRFALDHYLSDESVWRMLRCARKAYALARGLIE